MSVFALFRERNLVIFMMAQALLQSGTVMIMAMAGLAAATLTTDERLLTAPLFFMFVTLMLSTWPAAMIYNRLGRKTGALFASGAGLIAVALAVAGLTSGSFTLFNAGSAVYGITMAFGAQFRFGAIESVDGSRRAQAVSFTLMGGIIAAVLGPTLAKATVDAGSVAFLGSYATIGALSVLTLVLLLCLDSSKFARPSQLSEAAPASPLSGLLARPGFVLALMAGVASYAAMNVIMVATPISMHNNGFSFHLSADVIQWHVLGMYVPSLFTGQLIARFGVNRILAAGVLAIFACAVINFSGVMALHYFSSLILLGIGWNFLYIGGTTLLSASHEPKDNAKAQGLNELVTFTGVACTALAAGWLLSSFGWMTVNAIGLALMLPVVALLVRGRRRRAA